MNYPKLGIKKLDDQHRDILLFLLQIAEYKENVPKIINTFMTYCTEHFDYEESLMKEMGYPYYIKHKQEHIEIKEKLAKEFIYSIRQITPEKIELMRMLTLAHISSYDKTMVDWYHANKNKCTNIDINEKNITNG
jgi:hemerythrin-like metal-binding protein